MKVDLAFAIIAHRSGLRGQALEDRLGVSALEAKVLSDVGRKLGRVNDHALTDSELQVMHQIAAVTRDLLQAGAIRSPKSREVSERAQKSSAWCASVVGKRLFVSRQNRFSGQAERGLGFVELAGNGSVWLTPTGWALIHAVEAAQAAAATPNNPAQ